MTLTKGKKVVLFGLPGAFTPTCSAKHVPGYVAHFDELKAKGVDEIICMSVNDAFVMGAWAKDQKTGGKVRMMGDGSAAYTKALGLELDLTARGMGVRCQRFSALVDDGVVKIAEHRGAGQVRSLGCGDDAEATRLSCGVRAKTAPAGAVLIRVAISEGRRRRRHDISGAWPVCRRADRGSNKRRRYGRRRLASLRCARWSPRESDSSFSSRARSASTLFPRSRRFFFGAGCCAACIMRSVSRTDMPRATTFAAAATCCAAGNPSNARACPMSSSPDEQIVLHRLGELRQPQQIRHRAARAADGLRRCLVRQAEFVDQPLDALRLLEGIQILALDVLDQRQRECRLVGHFAHQRGHLRQPRAPRRHASAVRRR